MTGQTNIRFTLGNGDELVALFSYPNTDKPESLGDVIAHYFRATLERDGFDSSKIDVQVESVDNQFHVSVTAPEGDAQRIKAYEPIWQRLLEIGWEALTGPVVELKEQSRWDPQKTGKWRFFLPLGLSMLEYRSIQFFHYPPLRLLNVYQDYLNDPVPRRWEQMLEFNGVPRAETPLYERYIDAAPIAAPDDQGAFIPIDAFAAYQRDLVKLFLKTSSTHPDYTIPIVVFGIPAMNVFEHMFHANLDILVPQKARIIDGKTTPVLGATHPYHFYAQAQIDDTQFIGAGKLGKGCQLAEMLMQQDLIAARWQAVMSADPSLDPGTVLNDCTAWWLDPARQKQVCQLVQHQGSMRTFGKDNLEFEFTRSLEQAADFCSANADNPCKGW